jgi:hypothetical protein
MRAIHSIFLLSLIFILPATQAAVFKWKDAQGKTIYGDQPPPAQLNKPINTPKNIIGKEAPIIPETSVASVAAPVDAQAEERKLDRVKNCINMKAQMGVLRQEKPPRLDEIKKTRQAMSVWCD